MNEEVVMVPLAAYESQAQHFHQTMRYMIIGWVITVALFVWLGIVMTSYEEEVVETTEAIETSTVTQSGGDYAGNYYAGGDINGYATGSQDDEDQND